MAQESGQERTEEATPKRLREAKEKGQIARSREVATFAMLAASGGALLFLGGGMASTMLDIMAKNFEFTRGPWKDPTMLTAAFLDAVYASLWSIAPLLVLLFVVALLAPAAIGGWIFSTEAVAFKWEKLDPIKGIGRLFSWKSALELFKAILKFVLVSAAIGIWLWIDYDNILGVGDRSLNDSIIEAGRLMIWALIIASAPLILIVIPDAFFQIWDHARQLKMTFQEVRDESKETDGNPEVKGRIRTIQRELSRRRMMAEVPKADVIITNPTHYAVALKYDQDKMRAPVVVAKGADLIAFQIRSVGTSYAVPILSAPPLARAIYHSTALKGEVPEGLYLAVAQVLAHVYQVKQKERPAGATPSFEDLPIPDHMRRDG